MNGIVPGPTGKADWSFFYPESPGESAKWRLVPNGMKNSAPATLLGRCSGS